MAKYTNKVKIGNKTIGGGEPVLIQSMTKTKTHDIEATINQINELEREGCDIIRVAVPDELSATSIKQIKSNISIPLVADIHFDYRLAILAIENGADKIRINPGNIGDIDRLKKIIEIAKNNDICIRVGINSGSLESDIIKKYSNSCSDAMVESAIRNVETIEKMGFTNIVVSLKSSDVIHTIDAYLKVSKLINYPLHVGVTEAGFASSGIIKSSVGIGTILYNGVGDTIRVSLTGNPIEEIKAAKQILSSLNLSNNGIEIISCPTCGRCNVNLFKIVQEVQEAIKGINTKKKIKLAIMGCAVNGPGEAKEADLGIAGGKDEFLLFVKGEIIKKIPSSNAYEEFLKELNKLL